MATPTAAPTTEPSNGTKAKREKVPTTYLVLAQEVDSSAFTPLGEVPARSPKEAIKLALERLGGGANLNGRTFVAVPARSWKPLTIQVESVTRTIFA